MNTYTKNEQTKTNEHTCPTCGKRDEGDIREDAAHAGEHARQDMREALLCQRMPGLIELIVKEVSEVEYLAQKHGWLVEEKILRSLHDDREGGQ